MNLSEMIKCLEHLKETRGDVQILVETDKGLHVPTDIGIELARVSDTQKCYVLIFW